MREEGKGSPVGRAVIRGTAVRPHKSRAGMKPGEVEDKEEFADHVVQVPQDSIVGLGRKVWAGTPCVGGGGSLDVNARPGGCWL